MIAINTIINLISVRSVSILITFLCVGILFSCSGGVSGPKINFSGAVFNSSDPDFTVKKTFEDDFPVENHIRVNVEAINGEVVVTGQSDAKSVMITAQLYVSSYNREDAELHIEDLDIVVTNDTDEILIQTVQPENINGRKYLVEYDIIVPDTFEVVTSQVNGTIAILDIQNSVEVSNENGDVLLQGIVAGITADVENGGIEASVILPINETIDLSIKNGGLVLSIPTSTSAEFSAYVAGTGTIIVSDLDINDFLSISKSLTGTFGNGEGSVLISTVDGSIEIIGFN